MEMIYMDLQAPRRPLWERGSLSSGFRAKVSGAVLD
jgi:hypothetical protein